MGYITWHGHVFRKGDDDVLKKVLDFKSNA